MTEIPEHLLKRSRERRSAMGGGDAGAGDGGVAAESTEASPAAAQSATPARSAPSMPAHPAPEPVPSAPPPSPLVEAYRRRRKVPFWAMPVLVALPVWAYIYQGTLSPPPAGEGPETLGEELYASAGCAGCHGAGGGGGVGPAFTGGSIFETWPTFVEHFEWVRLGSSGWQAERGDTYGANGKPVQGGMPGFGEDQLTDAELLYVVLYERTLGGENPDEEDMLALEEVALLMSENEGMTLADALEEVGIEAPDAPEGGTGGDTGTPPPGNTAESEDTPGSEGNEGTGTTDEGTGEGAGGANQTGGGGADADEESPPAATGDQDG